MFYLDYVPHLDDAADNSLNTEVIYRLNISTNAIADVVTDTISSGKLCQPPT